MRALAALVGVALLPCAAFAEGLDLGAVRDRVAAQAAATTGGTRAAYLKLQRALARPDRPGIVDDLGKLAAVASAVEGRLKTDVPLTDAVSAALDAAQGSLGRESARLLGSAATLESEQGRARCHVVVERARSLANLSAQAVVDDHKAAAAAFARRAAAAYTGGLALAAKLVASENRRRASWSVPLHDLGGALLSVWAEPGPTPTVYAVGTDDGSGPIFLRMGGEGWVRVPVAASGTLGCVTGVGDAVYAAGTGGRVVRYDPVSAGVTELPVGVDTTLHGVWGSSEDDVWAVGGNVDGSQPVTALFHHDGQTWTAVTPPPEATGLTLFDVAGSAADDVWACGQGGLVMHFDGISWTAQLELPHESLFAVHGTPRLVVVGGTAQPTLLERGASEFASPRLPPGPAALRGVFAPRKGDAWACGLAGTVLRRTQGAWRQVAGVPSATGNDFSAAWMDDAGGVYFAGGDLVHLDKGSLLYFGPRSLPTTVLSQAKLSEKIAPLFSAAPGALRPWTCAVGGCHVAGSPSEGLNLFTGSHPMRTQLVDVASTQSPLLRVLPGRPSQSYLLHKLAGTHASVEGIGDRMPVGELRLSQADMDAVRAWILEGALDN